MVSHHASARRPLLIGATTSIENSGLLAHLLEQFQEDHEIDVRAVVAGTGAILKMASRGDLSAILVHAPEDEEAFMQAGHGVDRRPVMYNHFLIAGPSSDPAGIREKTKAAVAFAAIAASQSLFLSRGDESGTHRAEQRLWRSAGIDIRYTPAFASWFRESGTGQGATLNIAVNLGAYCLTDDATWYTFKNRGKLNALFDRDDVQMLNPYSIILVNPARFSKVTMADATAFADWLTSGAGHDVITSFKVGGKSLFRPGQIGDLAG